jgi:hypothetical protein
MKTPYDNAYSRITVAQVIQAYKKTRLSPAAEAFYDSGRVCPVGALGISTGAFTLRELSDFPGLSQTEIAERLNLPPGYMAGVLDAVDGNAEPYGYGDVHLEYYALGKEDGMAIKAAVFGN